MMLEQIRTSAAIALKSTWFERDKRLISASADLSIHGTFL